MTVYISLHHFFKEEREVDFFSLKIARLPMSTHYIKPCWVLFHMALLGKISYHPKIASKCSVVMLWFGLDTKNTSITVWLRIPDLFSTKKPLEISSGVLKNLPEPASLVLLMPPPASPLPDVINKHVNMSTAPYLVQMLTLHVPVVCINLFTFQDSRCLLFQDKIMCVKIFYC